MESQAAQSFRPTELVKQAQPVRPAPQPMRRIPRLYVVLTILVSAGLLLQHWLVPGFTMQRLALSGAACGTLEATTGPWLSSVWDESIAGIAAISPNDVWAVGSTHSLMGRIEEVDGDQPVALHWDGKQWRDVNVPKPGGGDGLDGYLYDVAGTASNNVWAVGEAKGQTLTMHWDGSSWQIVPSPSVDTWAEGLYGVAVHSSSDAWAVGKYRDQDNQEQALILHWNGASWQIAHQHNRTGGAGALQDVAALAPDDIWAAGGDLILHWDGTSWQSVAIPETAMPISFDSLDAVSRSDIWAVGSSNGKGVAAHWDGMRWQLVPVPSGTGHLYSIAASSANSVWAVGNTEPQVVAIHWDGTHWASVYASRQFSAVGSSSMLTGSLTNLTSDQSGHIWGSGVAVGNNSNPHYGLLTRFDSQPCGK